MLANRPAKESAPETCMVSIIMARAPDPDNGFITMVGRASTQAVSKPSSATPARAASTKAGRAPLARSMPMATSMATR